jgi:hypothetical protein
MDRIEQRLKWSDELFKLRVGTTKPVFHEMHAVLQAKYIKLHEFGGNPKGLTVSDKLLITLKYYREYTTMDFIGVEFGCSKSTVCRSIVWVEDTLSADGRFQLPGKQALQEDEVKIVGIDVTEHPIERPKKNKRIGIPASKRIIR